MASSMQLASGFVREINDTLVNIDVAAEWIRDLIQKDLAQRKNVTEMKEGLNQIKSEVSRGRKATDRILRITRGTLPIIRDLKVNDVLNDLLELMDRELRSNHIRVRRDYQDDIPSIRSDRSRVSQVFQNLILNAMAAIERDGEIQVRTRRRENGVTVTVTDNGPGIPKEYIEEIFDPLSTTNRKTAGGLGLSICVRALEKLGGRISVQSEVGKGSSFVVELPFQMKSSEA